MNGCSAAFAFVSVTPGLSRPNAFTHRDLRSVSIFMGPMMISFSIITGIKIFAEYPSSTPSKPACATPIIVISCLLISTVFPTICRSPPKRCLQKS